MKAYKGNRSGDEFVFTVEENGKTAPLKHVVRHSPTGLSFGYMGSGCADLALSILVDMIGWSPTRPIYMLFKGRVISQLIQGLPWVLTEEDIRKALGDVLPTSIRKTGYGSRNVDRSPEHNDIFYCGKTLKIESDEHAVDLGLFSAFQEGYTDYVVIDGTPRACMPLSASDSHENHLWQYGKKGHLFCECGADLGVY